MKERFELCRKKSIQHYFKCTVYQEVQFNTKKCFPNEQTKPKMNYSNDLFKQIRHPWYYQSRSCNMNKFKALASSLAVMLHSSQSSFGDTMTLSNVRISDSSSSAFWKTFIFSETSARRHKRAGWVVGVGGRNISEAEVWGLSLFLRSLKRKEKHLEALTVKWEKTLTCPEERKCVL